MVKMKHNKTNATNLAATLTAAIIMIFAILLAPSPARAQSVNTFSGLQNAIANFASATGDMVITVSVNMDITAPLSIPANANAILTIKGVNQSITLTRGITDNLFTVDSGASLILENIIIDGNKGVYQSGSCGSLVMVSGGDFVMNSGAILRNNRARSSTGAHGGAVEVGSIANTGIFTMNGGEISGNISDFGGGVSVGDTFTMNDGVISNNIASWRGGGVEIGGRFTMLDGKINGNIVTGNSDTSGHGGGVYTVKASNVSGIFTMTGGEISGNTAPGDGGGVHAEGTFTLGGSAVISGNTKNDGTANNVYLATYPGDNVNYITISATAQPVSGMEIWVTSDSSSVIVNSGASASIAQHFHSDESGKTVAYYMDRLFIIEEYGPFLDFFQQVMSHESSIGDKTIYIDNDLLLTSTVVIPTNESTLTIKSADVNNPVILTRGFTGVLFFVDPGARLILENIIIDGNNDVYTGSAGSLVQVNGGEFTMNGGAILRNNRMNYYNMAGGVNVRSGTFTMTGGEISGNTAIVSGGGVFVWDPGTFTMTGGEISGNDAAIDSYGASYCGGVYVSGTFTMTGGKISGNTAIWYGGGVCAPSTFTMTGGEISGNIVHNDGGRCGGVYTSYGTFTMTGGEISGNIATYGGGVCVNWIHVAIGGTAVIRNNTNSDGMANNVYLANAITLSASVPPVSGMEIWVSSGNGVIVDYGADASHTQYFHADESGKMVTYYKNKLLLIDDHGSFTDLFLALASYEFAIDDMTIYVDHDLTLTTPLTIYEPANANVTLTIKSTDVNNPIAMSRGFSTGCLFLVASGAKLVFENIIIDGNNDGYTTNTDSLVCVNGGEFTMNNGAILRNNVGGGVNVRGGTFNMDSGEISGNHRYSQGFTGGGGVIVDYGTFNMSGGKISGNRAVYYSDGGGGGGVFISGGTFNMSGGEISGNTVYSTSYYNSSFNNGGGGVFVSGGTFNMSGGEISGNTAPLEILSSSSSGGGVFVYNGTFNMNGGEISGNDATAAGGSYGGGVFISPNSTFNNTFGRNAVVFNNTVDNNTGNNVYISGGKFITVGTGIDEPTPGMNVGVQTETPSGVIVDSGAGAGHAQYFFADEPGKTVVYANGQLVIAPVYAVTVLSAGTGATGGGNYAAGATVSINAGTPPTGQQFKNWTSSPGVTFANANNANTTFTMPAGAVTVTANFETPCYDVTASSAGTGATVVGCYVPGDTVNISAGTPPVGMQFKNWTASPAVSFANASSPNTTFTMPSNAVTVTANFETITYAVTVSSAGTGASGGGNYVAGATVSINAGTPPEGQRFKNWTASPGVTFANANSANTTFTMPSGAITVTANFEPDVQISDESIFVTGMRPEFQIGLTRYDSTWVSAPEFPGIGDVEFAVAGGDGPFVLWIGITDVYPIVTLDGINAGEIRDVSDYFYDIAVPEDVSGVEMSFFEDAWYGDFSEGDIITLLKTNDEGLLVFERDGVYYEKTFVPDGSNPFPGEEPGVEPVVTVPSASVEKLGGGMESLTISYTETLSDGSTVAGTMAVTINENTAGYYQVGQYLIYVDALGSGSIRRCYIVNRD